MCVVLNHFDLGPDILHNYILLLVNSNIISLLVELWSFFLNPQEFNIDLSNIKDDFKLSDIYFLF